MAIRRLRSKWTTRGKGFYTLGVAAYQDAELEDVAAVERYYYLAVESNAMLMKYFHAVSHKTALAIASTLGLQASFAHQLAIPGFHIWLGDAIPRPCAP